MSSIPTIKSETRNTPEFQNYYLGVVSKDNSQWVSTAYFSTSKREVLFSLQNSWEDYPYKKIVEIKLPY